MIFIPAQSTESEWMDGENYSEEDLNHSLKDLRWLNRYLGGYSIIINHLASYAKKNGLQKFTILDVATGSGDIPKKVVEWGRKNKLDILILAIDKNPDSIELAKRDAVKYPEIKFDVNDFYKVPYSPDSFDFCISSLFFHHLSRVQTGPFLKRMHSLSRKAVIISDLSRGWFTYYAYYLVSQAAHFHSMTKHDGLISILRAFTVQEIKGILKENGFDSYRIFCRFLPGRLSFMIHKGSVA